VTGCGFGCWSIDLREHERRGGENPNPIFFSFFLSFFLFLLGSSFCDPAAHSPISPHLAFYFPCWFLFFPSPLRSILNNGLLFSSPFILRNLRPRGPSSFQVLTWGDEQERSRGASTQVVIKSCQADNDGASNGTKDDVEVVSRHWTFIALLERKKTRQSTRENIDVCCSRHICWVRRDVRFSFHY
jgi:hypothetical protein